MIVKARQCFIQGVFQFQTSGEGFYFRPTLGALENRAADGESMSAAATPILLLRPIFSMVVLMCTCLLNAQDTTRVVEEQADFLEDEVKYSANDSIRFDIVEQRVYLYGQAEISYQDIVLKANRIAYDMDDQTLEAFGTVDSLGQAVGKPEMDQAGTTFEADSIRYNFGTKVGIVRHVRTNEMESYVHADLSKRHSNGEIHNKGGKFTTCDRPDPHYHFRVGKMMVIPDKKIIVGPAFMKVGKVPTPLAIPFGFFPNKQNGSSGILVPIWGESQALGIYLLNGGFYMPLSERMDLQLTGDIYSRGSWGARATTRYKTRYRYSGSFELSTNTRVNGDRELNTFSRTRSFFVRWNHQMDGKASLNDRFSASINAGSSNNFSNTINSSTFDYLSNTFQSNVSWTHTVRNWWAGSYGVNLRHSQNTLNRSFDLTLPSINWNMNRMNFGQLFTAGRGAGNFLDDLAFTYSLNFDNRLSTTEDQLSFRNIQGLRTDLNNGVRHNFNLTTSYKNRFFTVNPRVTMTDRMYFRTIDKRYLAAQDSLVTDTLPGFANGFDWNASVSLTSKLYGMFKFRGKNLKAIRHVITPTIGLSYQPNLSTEIEGPFGANGTLDTYSPLDIGIYGKPSSLESGRVNFNLVQSLEAKVRDKKNSTEDELKTRKVRLLEFLGIGTNYDMIRDSINWSNVSIAARTRIANRFNVNFNSSFDPYAINEAGTTYNTSEWKVNRRLARLENANLAFGFNFKSRRYGQAGQESNAQDDDTVVGEDNPDKGARIDLRIPWQLNVNYSYDYAKPSNDPAVVRNSILANGDLNLTKNMKLGFSTGYDVVELEFTPTSLNLFYDLHCWEFNVNYIPNGFRRSISFRINVKASILRDLKYEQRRPIDNDGNFLF